MLPLSYFRGNSKLLQVKKAHCKSPVDGSIFFTLKMFLQVIIKNMGWNLVGPVVRCLLWNKEDEKRKYYFLMLDLLVKVS